MTTTSTNPNRTFGSPGVPKSAPLAREASLEEFPEAPRESPPRSPSCRSADGGTARQLFLESDEYTLDLRVAGFATPEIGSVAGFCVHGGGRPVANAPAYLLCDGRLAAAGKTTELGEFEFQGRLDSPVELWLFDESQKPITVKLRQPDDLASG